MDELVGERLRYVRSLHGVSQRELARRTGIANSTISLIEANRTNPSVAALSRLLDGIPINLAEFFSMDLRPPQVLFGPHESLEIGKGAAILRTMRDRSAGRSLYIVREHYEPGADSGQVMLRHDGEEVAIVLSGCVEVTVDEECRCLTAGDAYYLDCNRPYRLRCVGAEPCEVICASTRPAIRA